MHDIIKEKVRLEQYNALMVIKDYWLSNEKKHAVIKMPTGTGKTGVIACIPYILSNCNNVLIIVPNKQLPKQIYEEITKKFWSKIEIDIVKLNFKYKILKGIKDKLNDNKCNIYICTIQAMMSIMRESSTLYSAIKNKVDLIIFDEGHREPSYKWNQVIKDLNKKTILFTATPYRNDKNKFNITKSKKYIYNLSYNDAIGKGYIKDVEFIRYEIEDTSLDKFINYILKLYKSEGKVIIRTDKSEVIKEIVYELNKKAENNIAIGIHSNFKNEIVLKKNYIKELNDEFQIFVHQNKLIEGIDMQEINTLVIHKAFENSRSIVQQVGRVLRKDTFEDSNKAKVYIESAKYNEYVSQWECFKKFDSDEYNDMFYINNKYRKKFNFDKDFYKSLRLSKITSIYYSKNAKIEDIKQLIKENLFLNNVDKYNEYSDSNMWIICYEFNRYSDILSNMFYVEKSLEYCIVIIIGKYICYYDTNGFNLDFDKLSFDVEVIDNDRILSLFNEKSNFKYVKTDRLDIRAYGKSGQATFGSQLERIYDSATENLVACTRVQAEINNINRYIGVSNSRINDNGKCDIDGYRKWVSHICSLLCKNNRNDYFNRFAKVQNDLGDAIATSIILMITDEEDITNSKVDKDVRINEHIYILKGGKFKLSIGNELVEGNLIIDKRKKGIRIRIKFDKNNYYINGISLTEYINNNKFRVLFSENLFYVNGYLYQPNINYFNINLEETNIGKRIYGLDILKGLSDEKMGNFSGDIKDYNYWDDKSVFGMLVKYIDTQKEFDCYVCDDLETEIADFIAINEKLNKIALIHCKQKNGRLSASSFHDVTGQVIKNLNYLAGIDVEVNNKHIAKHVIKWNKCWKESKIGRITPNNLTGEEFWNKYKKILENPYKTIEVWIFGDLMSKEALRKNLDSDKPTEETKQIMWSLNATDEAVSNVGATLKIFCKK